MENKNSGKKVFSVLGIIVGIAAIGFGIAVLCVVPRYASFGGDFYSYIYKAARGAGLGIGFLLLFFGLADIAFFGVKLCEKPVVVTQSAPSQPIKKEVDEVPEI